MPPRDICLACPHNRATGRIGVLCGITNKGVAFTSRCPDGKWGASPKPTATPPDHVFICAARHLEWPVSAWQQIQACPLIGSKFRVPRELFEKIKQLHNPPE